MYLFRGSLGRKYERAALGVVAVSVLALYAAGFAGVEFAVAARPDATEPIQALPSYQDAARNELPVLTGPAIRDLAGAAKSLTTPIIVPNSGSLWDQPAFAASPRTPAKKARMRPNVVTTSATRSAPNPRRTYTTPWAVPRAK